MIIIKKSIKRQPKSINKIIRFKPMIRTRHPSYNWLKQELKGVYSKFRILIRFGSTTSLREAYPTKTQEQLSKVIQINSIEGIKNSSNKLLMKQCFTIVGIKTADWFRFSTEGANWLNMKSFLKPENEGDGENLNINDLPYPIISKHIYGSRGTGNQLINNQQELEQFIQNKDLSKYIFEKYYSYSKEYRLHVTKDGCFYTCRKMLKSDCPDDKRWQRHDDNCVWILEENPLFDKPNSWEDIVNDCVKALRELKLDICCFDVKTQSSKDKKGNVREYQDYIIIESNSAPSMGNITQIKYKEKLLEMFSKL